MNERQVLLEVNNLSKRFYLKQGKVLDAVDDVSLIIHKNETLGLVGESGSGKSTLGQLIMGLLERSAGEISFEGRALSSKRSHKALAQQANQMQMIFQNPFSSFNPRMTVSDILREPLVLRGANKQHNTSEGDAHEQLVLDWVGKVGLLADHLNRYPHEFSGGQRQRIAIARALINEPCFVVCDEPVSALDLSIQAQIINMLIDLKRSMGLSLLFIAHDLTMVRYISDRIAVMYKGRIVELGLSHDVYSNPKHPYTRSLIDADLAADSKRRGSGGSSLVNGSVITEVDSEKGCSYVAHCAKSTDRCRVEKPVLTSDVDNSDRLIACHLYT